MNANKILAGCAATLALVLAPTAPALAAAGPTVTVRIEGRTQTLLSSTTLHTQTGSITTGGAPKGACSATSAAGALDVATHHRWSGKFYSSFSDYLIKSIFGEAPNSKKYYWGFWRNDRFSSTGVCATALHAGDQLLFAVDSISHHEHPLAVTAPRSVRVGSTFTVKVVAFSDAGVPSPRAGAPVSDHTGISVLTDRHGIARILAGHTGTLVLGASETGYIRAAPVRVRITP